MTTQAGRAITTRAGRVHLRDLTLFAATGEQYPLCQMPARDYLLDPSKYTWGVSDTMRGVTCRRCLTLYPIRYPAQADEDRQADLGAELAFERAASHSLREMLEEMASPIPTGGLVKK